MSRKEDLRLQILAEMLVDCQSRHVRGWNQIQCDNRCLDEAEQLLDDFETEIRLDDRDQD